MKTFNLKTVAIILTVLVLSFMTTGCVTTSPLAGPTTSYEQNEVYRQVPVEIGVIISVKNVKIKASSTNNLVGTGLGAVVGASAFRKNNAYEKVIAGTIGGIVGSMVGSSITAVEGEEILLQLKNSRLVRITQPKGEYPFEKGQLVAVSGGRVSMMQ
jgi:outer membrane lipoprotein SlyB